MLSQDNAKNSNIVLTSESNEMDRVRLVSDSLWADYDYDGMNTELNLANVINQIDVLNDVYNYSISAMLSDMISRDFIEGSNKIVRKNIDIEIFDRKESDIILGFINVIFNKNIGIKTSTIITRDAIRPNYDIVMSEIKENIKEFINIEHIKGKYGDLSSGIIYYINIIYKELNILSLTIESIKGYNDDALMYILKNIIGTDDAESANRVLCFFRLRSDNPYHLLINLSKMTSKSEIIMNLKKISEKRDHNVIYTYLIIDNSNKLVKIGKTTDLVKRLSCIRTSNVNIELIASVNKDIEKELHRKYEVYAYSGEWFHLNDKMINDIISKYGFRVYPSYKKNKGHS